MPAFKVPIAAKAVLLIAALGLLSIAANALCLQRFHELERLNAELTEHVAPARLALAEAKASLESFGLAVYKTYSASDPDQVKESLEAIESVLETPESDEPPSLIGSYSSAGANYKIFADGSIEAETSEGTFKFPSMSDFKRHLAEAKAKTAPVAE